MASKRVVLTLVVQVRLADGREKTWRVRSSSPKTEAKQKARAGAKARAESLGAEIVSTKWTEKTVWRVLIPQPGGGPYREKQFTSKTKAEAWEKAHETAQVIGVDLDLAKEKLGSVAERWRAGASGDWGAANAAQVDSFLNAHILPEFGTVAVGAVRFSDVQKWYVRMRTQGLAQSTTRRVVRLLDRILQTSVRDGAIHRNPCSGIDFGKDQGPVREGLWLERPEIHKVALAMSPRYRVAVLVAHGAALRFQEMAGLRRDRILAGPGMEVGTPRIRIDSVLIEVSGHLDEKEPKTNAGLREVPIPKWLADALIAHCDRFEVEAGDAENEAGLVFTTPSGTPLRRGAYAKRVLYPASKKALGGRVVRTHDLRRSGISQWIADGIRPEVAQVWAGHEDLRTTMGIYHSVFPSTETASVALLEEANSEVEIDLGWSTFGAGEGDAQSEAS